MEGYGCKNNGRAAQPRRVGSRCGPGPARFCLGRDQSQATIFFSHACERGEGTAGRPAAGGVCLDTLTRLAGAHALFHRRRQAGPPHRAARQGKRAITAKLPNQRSGMQLVQHLGLKRSGKAQAVDARAEAESPVPPGEAAPRGTRRSWRLGAGACCRRRKGPQDRIRGGRRANRGREIGGQEARRPCGGPGGHEPGGRAGRGEQLEGRARLGVARVRRRARAIREALPGKEVGRVGAAARDVHGTMLQKVGRARAFPLGRFTRLEGDGMKRARVVGLLQDGRHVQLRGWGELVRRPRRVAHA